MIPEPSVSRRAFLAAAAAACALARRRLSVPGTDRRTAPLVYDASGGLYLDARLKGRGADDRFVLDTGASRSAVSENVVKALGLELHDGGEVEGSAGVAKVRAAAVDVDVPGLGAVSLDATVYALANPDPKCVGILGREVLSKAPFQLRYRDRQIVWAAPAPKETVPMTLDGGIPRIAATVNGVRIDLRIDTGATLPPGEESYLNLTEDQAAKAGLTGKPAAVWSATGTGGATLSLPVHRLASAKIGERDLAKPFAIVQPKVGYFARPDAVGFLGNAVLDKLDPFLDYAGGKFGIGG
jgi:predicted aspartyl protease